MTISKKDLRWERFATERRYLHTSSSVANDRRPNEDVRRPRGMPAWFWSLQNRQRNLNELYKPTESDYQLNSMTLAWQNRTEASEIGEIVEFRFI